jgi:hypothetical protein
MTHASKVVTIPLAARTARATGLAIGEPCEGPVCVAPDGRRLDRHGAARIVRQVARRAGITKPVGPRAGQAAVLGLRALRQPALRHHDRMARTRARRDEPPPRPDQLVLRGILGETGLDPADLRQAACSTTSCTVSTGCQRG